MPSKTNFRVIHVFPNSARLSCGPCNAVMAFMESQLRHGLDVRAVGPVDNHIPPDRSQPVAHLLLKEFDLAAGDFCSQMLAQAEGARSLFHFHGISPWSDLLAKQLTAAAVPYVFTSHGQLNFHGPVHAFKKFVYVSFVSPFIRQAAGLHFLTRREKERFRFILPLWCKPHLIQPNLVPLPDVEAVVPLSRAQSGLPDNAFVFAYLGRLDVENKGLDLLLDAFAQIASHAETGLILIGPDFKNGRQFLEQRARRLGCENKVRFLGPQNGPAKWSALKMADAFVFPSRWEAFGIALAEAVGMGLPAIVSDKINIAPELAARRAALISPLSPAALAGAMRKLMKDAALHSLADAGRLWVKEACSHESAGPRFDAFYESVLQG